MRVLFQDANLEALYAEGPQGAKGSKVARRYPAAVIQAFFDVMSVIAIANSPFELSQSRGLHYHALRGSRSGQKALRLNRQFRLIVRELRDEQGHEMLIIEIVDYH